MFQYVITVPHAIPWFIMGQNSQIIIALCYETNINFITIKQCIQLTTYGKMWSNRFSFGNIRYNRKWCFRFHLTLTPERSYNAPKVRNRIVVTFYVYFHLSLLPRLHWMNCGGRLNIAKNRKPSKEQRWQRRCWKAMNHRVSLRFFILDRCTFKAGQVMQNCYYSF